MKRTLITTLFILLTAGALGLTLFTMTKKVNAEVAAGNRAFSELDYETALKHYERAQSQIPGRAEPLYNAANTFYKQQALDKAQQSLEQALAQPHEAIEAFIYFNLGNVAYMAKQFEAAIAQYESTLRIDPADQAAKYNLELALLQQQKRQNQQQEQQDQQNQQSQPDQQQGQQGQQQNQQDPQNQQDQQDQQQGQQGQQQGQQDQQPGQQGQQPGQQGQQQGQQDQQPGQQGQQQSQQDQQPGQQGQQQNQQGQSGQPQEQEPGQPNGQMAGVQPQEGLTKEQAAQLLAAIAGNSKTLLQQLQMYYYFPGATPEKDW